MSTEFIGNEDKVDVNQRMQTGRAGSAFVDVFDQIYEILMGTFPDIAVMQIGGADIFRAGTNQPVITPLFKNV
jgi:hypothetical protein